MADKENKGKMENNFLAVNKEYFNIGLKSIDLLIISQIEEYARNDCSCYVTNKQFSEMFGESESTIKRSINKLEELEIIKRNTSCNNDGSKASRIRTLSIGEARFKTNHTSISKVKNTDMQGSNVDEARFKNEISKVHNKPIKENNRKFFPFDLIEFVLDKFKDGNKYTQIISQAKTTLNVEISFDDVKEIITDRDAYEADAEKQKQEAYKQRLRQYEYEHIPEAIEKLSTYGIITTANEIKTAYDEIQNSNRCSKWSVCDLMENQYLNKSFIENTTTLSEYTHKITKSMDEQQFVCYTPPIKLTPHKPKRNRISELYQEIYEDKQNNAESETPVSEDIEDIPSMRVLAEISEQNAKTKENFSIDEAKRVAYNHCVKHNCIDAVDYVYEQIGMNADGLFQMSISKNMLNDTIKESINDYECGLI